MLGAARPVAAPNLMVALEGGWRLGNGPAWLHAAASWGDTGDDQGPGSNRQLRGGVEGRACVPDGTICGAGGLDAGFQNGHWSSRDNPTHNDSSDALVVIPRAGWDLGGHHWRARLGLEVDYGVIARRERNPVTAGLPSGASRGLVGVEANAGLAYQW
ncbi:MAG TPA: hypothetical protein VHU40_05400 [Polyangia bacterium]|nr:hypothetical protein [Polyangia bacterium]